MNFSPENRTTLETLLAGLGAGVSGEQAAPILAATLQAQAAQQDARTARYQQMATDVTGMASAGMPYGATSNYIDAMTPQSGIPGKFQGLLDSAFANPDIPQQLQAQAGLQTPGYMSQPGGGFAMQEAPPLSPDIQAQLQSPLYTQNPANTGAYNMNPNQSQGNLMTAPGQARYAAMQGLLSAQGAPPEPSDADMMGAVNAQINNYKAAGKTPEEIAQLIMGDPEVQGVIISNLSEFQLTQPEITGILAPGIGV